MGDKGRDLKVSVLSDADEFDLGKPARDLEDLGDAARSAGTELSQLSDAGDQLAVVGSDASDASRDLDRLGSAAKDAERDLHKLGRADLGDTDKDAKKAAKAVDGMAHDADAAAKKVDGAFDKIAASSKRAAKDVDKSMDKAGEGLDEFKDESAGTAREAAASFTGSFDDVAGTVQEVMANAFAGFGPIGMAGGIAAAAGIGFLVSSITEAKERVKELAAGLLDLKLDPDMDTASGRIRQVLDELKDAGDLERFRSATEAAGISWADYVTALAEGGDKAERVKAQLQPLIDGWGGASAMFTEAGGGANDLMNRLKDQEAATVDATGAAQAYTDGLAIVPEAVEESSVAIQGLTDALANFTDPATVYSDLLNTLETKERDRATAVAQGTKDSKDSWEDYAKSVDVSVGQYLDALSRQVTAQEQWAGNLAKLARRGVTEGTLAELEKLGPQGAPLVAKLTTASNTELNKLVNLMTRKGKDSSGALAAGIEAGAPTVAGKVSWIKEDARRQLAPGVYLPVKVTPPPAGQASAIRRDVQNNMRPVEIPIMLRNVPASTWSRFIP